MIREETGGEAKASIVGKLYARGAEHKATGMESDGHNVIWSNVARCVLGAPWVDDVFVQIQLGLEQDQTRIIAHGS